MECGEWDLACIAMQVDVAPAAESEMGDEARLRWGWSQLVKWHWTSHPRGVNASVEFTTITTTSTRISLTADTFSLLLSAPFASRDAGGKVLILFFALLQNFNSRHNDTSWEQRCDWSSSGKGFLCLSAFCFFARLRRSVWME